MSAPMKRLSTSVVGLALLASLGAASYTVAAGDSLSEIAENNGVSTRALADANGLANPDMIRIGQVLEIPTAAIAAAMHEVQPGDRLADIARANNTTIKAIAAANGIDDINLIRIGQVLEIPGMQGSSSENDADPTSYRVTSGDALSLIAARFGLPTVLLAEANAITNVDKILVGSVLKIPAVGDTPPPDPAPAPADEPAPAPAPAPAPEPAARTYVVAAGDALSIIARDNGVTTDALAAANGITNPATIFVGQTLTIPSSETAEVAPSPEPAAEPAEEPAETPAPIPLPNPSDPKTVLEPTYYQVQSGDTLSAIAASFVGMRAEDIAFANGLGGDGDLQVGATLVIPVLERNTRGVVSPDAFKANNETFHTVADGETMTSIADAFGVDVNQLAELNGIGDIRYVAVGHVLEIPANRWVCPLPNAIFINDWGFPRTGGRTHEGNDLFVAIGTPIAAPVAGVLTNKEGPVGGLQFNLVGDDGVTYIGSHLSDFGAEGRVSPGDVIGYVGDSGNAAGAKPHLHFEMHPGGLDAPVNPYPTLVRACR
ncbi:MAG: LysM peptidoglycan-binding domain-containing protein [Acidimicrobiia bacterium]|nr:LysM peptidoglycan-binding domain-containing protein [Acidimicrobiia bacterium]